jgi:hypothetical protein
LAGAVLEPTMVVGSGYGVQPYYLLDEMLSLASDEDRARAKLLGRRLHARLRLEARDRGVEKFDSVFDLARILRPPGSANGKLAADPRPVVLLDDGGPRYTLAELEAIAPPTEEQPPPNTGATAGEASAKRAQEVLDRHEDLARLAARTGAKPGKGSPSEWDLALGCRAAEHGYDDAVLRALIRLARRKHGEDKGERDDYIDLTIKAIRERVPYVAPAAGVAEYRAAINQEIPFAEIGRAAVATRVQGHGISASTWIVLDDGYEIDFASFEHITQPTKLADMLATTVGITTEFSKFAVASHRVVRQARRRSRQRDARPRGVHRRGAQDARPRPGHAVRL